MRHKIKAMPFVLCYTKDGDTEVWIMDKETALHDIDKLEEAIEFISATHEKETVRVKELIESFKDRIKELKKIAES